MVDALKLKEYFDLLIWNMRGENKSQLLARILNSFDTTCGVMVGDRHFDKTAARDNRIPFIGCGYGIYPDEVKDADVVLQNASELPAAVDRLFS